MKLKTNDYVTRRQQKKVSISYKKLKWTWWQIHITINEQKNFFLVVTVLQCLKSLLTYTYLSSLGPRGLLRPEKKLIII